MIDEFSAECLIRFHRSGGGEGKREAGYISMLFRLIENLHAKGVNEIDGLAVEQMATQKGNLINQSWNRKNKFEVHSERIPDGLPLFQCSSST